MGSLRGQLHDFIMAGAILRTKENLTYFTCPPPHRLILSGQPCSQQTRTENNPEPAVSHAPKHLEKREGSWTVRPLEEAYLGWEMGQNYYRAISCSPQLKEKYYNRLMRLMYPTQKMSCIQQQDASKKILTMVPWNPSKPIDPIIHIVPPFSYP